MDASSLLVEVHMLSMPDRAYLWQCFKNIQNVKEKQKRERRSEKEGETSVRVIYNPINVTKHDIVGITTLHKGKVIDNLSISLL